MVNDITNVVQALSSIIPTTNNTYKPCIYDQFQDDEITIPVITYRIGNNARLVDSNPIRYSSIQFIVKLYADKLSDIDTYTPQIDTAMLSLGYHRSGTSSLEENNQICIVMIYDGVGYEY